MTTGLPADENFRDKLDVLRAQGRRLCERRAWPSTRA